jgi:hypothetical protein
MNIMNKKRRYVRGAKPLPSKKKFKKIKIQIIICALFLGVCAVIINFGGDWAFYAREKIYNNIFYSIDYNESIEAMGDAYEVVFD